MVVGTEQSTAAGKAARRRVPLESHREFEPAPGRDPVGLLLGQAQTRVPELVAVRHGRMLVSPFTFFRGAALPMAADASPPRPVGGSVQPGRGAAPSRPAARRVPGGRGADEQAAVTVHR